jgi:ribosomal protein S18 acetylase RimI-like enzyme
MNIVVNSSGKDEIKNFVRDHSSDFSPSFVEQIGDIDSYIEKIFANAVRYEVTKEKQIIALMFVYFNDKLSQIYIPYICVDSKMRGLNLGTSFINLLKSKKEYKAIRLEVYKDTPAFLFYRNHEFFIEEDKGEKYLMSLTLKD